MKLLLLSRKPFANISTKLLFVAFFCFFVLDMNAVSGARILKVLIIDGQNHHAVWPKSTVMLKQYLEETGRFSVVVERTKYLYNSVEFEDWLPLANAKEGKEAKPQTDPDFNPRFSDYDVVISNFGYKAAPWPEQTQRNFEAYIRQGGGFVSIHSADNCFANWKAYNDMIAIGGWGGRTDKSGVYLYVDAANNPKRDSAKGPVGAHGKREPFVVTTYNTKHPITKGFPKQWLHATDECYAYLRGPAKNVNILATAVSTKKAPELQQKEPMVMAVSYGKGRVFHTTLGHQTESYECVGFITLFKRGVEWAATGKVKHQDLPEDFPSKNKVSRRIFEFKN